DGADIGFGPGVGHQHGVVDIPSLLSPRIKDYPFPRVVGMQSGNHTFDGVVEEHWADADANIELEAVRVGKERLVLADRLALVVEDGPAATHPARATVVGCQDRLAVRANDDLTRDVARGDGPGFGLDLFLNLAAEAVGIRQAGLDP